MRTAIIGTGISGLGLAYLLAPHQDIYLYEKSTDLGGHSRTIDITSDNVKTSVDTGFIVFNNWNYPNLIALFKLLEVPYQKSDMSFGVSINQGWLEYGSSGLFAQKRNWLRPDYYRMLRDIIRFNKQALTYLSKDTHLNLGQCIDQMGMGQWFKRYYLLAMGAAIWSCPIETVMKFPAKTFLAFFKNHGLLNLIKRPQWYTVTGGSREYIKRLTLPFENKIKLDCAAKKVFCKNNQVRIEDSQGTSEIFDQVIFACHADQAIKIIQGEKDCKTVLSQFNYQSNKIVVHNDQSFMPKRKKCWASWVYLSESQKDSKPVVSLSYWMNNLQKIKTKDPIFVTLNPTRPPKQQYIFDEHYFSHPIFDQKAIDAQQQIKSIQGKNKLWFCGAYQGYGFHEDGLTSAIDIAKTMGVPIPWNP